MLLNFTHFNTSEHDVKWDGDDRGEGEEGGERWRRRISFQSDPRWETEYANILSRGSTKTRSYLSIFVILHHDFSFPILLFPILSLLLSFSYFPHSLNSHVETADEPSDERRLGSKTTSMFSSVCSVKYHEMAKGDEEEETNQQRMCPHF
jgi:hypothetical protein